MKDLTAKLEEYFDKYDVETRDTSSKEYFTAAVKIALVEYGLPILVMCDELHVAKSTIERWSDGRSVPGKSVRSRVLQYIDDVI